MRTVPNTDETGTPKERRNWPAGFGLAPAWAASRFRFGRRYVCPIDPTIDQYPRQLGPAPVRSLSRRAVASLPGPFPARTAITCLATIDGGINWTDITPSNRKRSAQSGGEAESQRARFSPSFWSPPFRSGIGTVRIPDSTCVTAPDSWHSGTCGAQPFFRFRPYIGGISVRMGAQYKPDRSWVTQVFNQGWLDAAVGGPRRPLRM